MLIPAVLFALALALGVIHSLAFTTAESKDSLLHLLGAAIALSGITVTVIVAYLSLGRALDIFSNLGDAIPYLYHKHGLDDFQINLARVRIAALTSEEVTEIEEINSEYAQQLDAVYDLSKLGNASAQHLEHGKKIWLVPQPLRDKYNRLFKDEIDEWVLRRYVWIVGAPGLVCAASLYLNHYNADEAAVLYAEHVAVIFCAFANLLAYYYLVRIGLARNDLERGITKSLEKLCADTPATIASMDARAKYTLRESVLDLASQVDENTEPDLFVDGDGI
jgi:hypothetical protein